MVPFGRGIISEQSEIYLYESSPHARSLYLYAVCAGHYHCSDHYLVDRQRYDSYLLLYVESGSVYVEQDGRHLDVTSRQFVLIDCYKPHVYGSTEGCELYWVHFDGLCAREYCEEIHMLELLTPRSFDRARRSIAHICEQSQRGRILDDADMHRLLTNALTEFLIGRHALHQEKTDVIDEIRNLILEHPEKPMTIDELAEIAHLSPYHFLRKFKDTVGMTPHEYLISARVNTARFYLKTSDQTIKEIAINCGFSSDSTFCTCFKKHTGMSPVEYRMIGAT